MMVNDLLQSFYMEYGVAQWCGRASTLMLFSAVAWKIFTSPTMPSIRKLKPFGCWWFITGSSIIVGVSAIAYMLENWDAPADWHLCGIRFGAAVLILARWGKRSGDQ